MSDISWDDPQLRVESDSEWKAQYRLLQSWYREKELRSEGSHVPPGRQPPQTDKEKARSKKRQNEFLGNLLPDTAVTKEPALNFLMRKEIADYAAQRADVKGGSIERTRLFHNMLSSMPLCFNLFGFLRKWPEIAASVVSDLLCLNVQKIEGTGILLRAGSVGIEVEEAPPPSDHLCDRTSFDAFIEYLTKSGKRGFLAIETKYTEPFSKTVYKAKLGKRDKYETATEESGLFYPGATVELQRAATNQLWRNVLLAISLRKKSGCAFGHVVVVACRKDTGARTALQGLREQLKPEADSVLKDASLEDLLASFTGHSEVSEWACQFNRRYLDLTPIQGAAKRPLASLPDHQSG